MQREDWKTSATLPRNYRSRNEFPAKGNFWIGRFFSSLVGGREGGISPPVAARTSNFSRNLCGKFSSRAIVHTSAIGIMRALGPAMQMQVSRI